MTNRQLIGRLDQGNVSSWMDIQRKQGAPSVRRQIALDHGFDAVVWEFSAGTMLPDRPAGAESLFEVAVLDGHSLVVIAD